MHNAYAMNCKHHYALLWNPPVYKGSRNNILFLVARPLRKKYFFLKLEKKSEKNVTTKLGGGGVRYGLSCRTTNK